MRLGSITLASLPSHAVVGLALGTALVRAPRLWLVGAACACVPDLDVVGFRFGVAYGDMLGHRGLTHSLPFALAFATLVWLAARRWAPPGEGLPAWLFLVLATASHGILDAFTDGGLGVAFLAPFSGERTFFPWRPIAVSPISVARFFGERGLRVLASEAVWIWLPAAALVAVSAVARRSSARSDRRSSPR
jgi:inner membrane protein